MYYRDEKELKNMKDNKNTLNNELNEEELVKVNGGIAVGENEVLDKKPDKSEKNAHECRA